MSSWSNGGHGAWADTLPYPSAEQPADVASQVTHEHGKPEQDVAEEKEGAGPSHSMLTVGDLHPSLLRALLDEDDDVGSTSSGDSDDVDHLAAGQELDVEFVEDISPPEAGSSDAPSKVAGAPEPGHRELASIVDSHLSSFQHRSTPHEARAKPHSDSRRHDTAIPGQVIVVTSSPSSSPVNLKSILKKTGTKRAQKKIMWADISSNNKKPLGTYIEIPNRFGLSSADMDAMQGWLPSGGVFLSSGRSGALLAGSGQPQQQPRRTAAVTEKASDGSVYQRVEAMYVGEDIQKALVSNESILPLFKEWQMSAIPTTEKRSLVSPPPVASSWSKHVDLERMKPSPYAQRHGRDGRMLLQGFLECGGPVCKELTIPGIHRAHATAQDLTTKPAPSSSAPAIKRERGGNTREVGESRANGSRKGGRGEDESDDEGALDDDGYVRAPPDGSLVGLTTFENE